MRDVLCCRWVKLCTQSCNWDMIQFRDKNRNLAYSFCLLGFSLQNIENTMHMGAHVMACPPCTWASWATGSAPKFHGRKPNRGDKYLKSNFLYESIIHAWHLRRIWLAKRRNKSAPTGARLLIHKQRAVLGFIMPKRAKMKSLVSSLF